MKNKMLFAVLVCLLLLPSLAGQALADDEKKIDIGGITYLASERMTIPDIRGKLMLLGLTPTGTQDFIFYDDVTISGDLIVSGAFTSGADFSGDIAMENEEILSNAYDAVISFTFNDDATEAGDFQIRTSNTAGGDGDIIRKSVWFIDDGAVDTEASYFDTSMDDETSNSFDSTIIWGVVTNDTLAPELKLNGTDLYPAADDGLNLGKVGNEFGALFLDGIATIDGLLVDDALADIGGGSYSLVTGDNDLGVAGNFEVVGNVLLQGAITMENGEFFANVVDAAVTLTFDDDAVELGDFKIASSNTAGEDGNYLRFSFEIFDDGGVATEAATIDVTMDDETSGTFDSTIGWGVVTNDTYAKELNLNGTDLYPETDNGLNLGKVGNEFGAGFFNGIMTVDGLLVDDALADIGGGSYSRADGDNDLGVAGDFEVVGIAEFDAEIVVIPKAISLTSPTTTIDVSGATWIVLNTDANQTGHTLTNGVIGVEYTITMGSGSNTAQFDDDGENMALGGNIVLTESHGDVIKLFCVATDDYVLTLDGSGN